MLDKHKDKLDIVAVCTPNLAHKTWSIAALKAGANVMCEKPLALTYRDAKEMFAVADACGKVLFPCQSRRWTNDMVFCKDAMEQAQIGKPYYADISFCRRYGIPSWGMFQHEGTERRRPLLRPRRSLRGQLAVDVRQSPCPVGVRHEL